MASAKRRPKETIRKQEAEKRLSKGARTSKSRLIRPLGHPSKRAKTKEQEEARPQGALKKEERNKE